MDEDDVKVASKIQSKDHTFSHAWKQAYFLLIFTTLCIRPGIIYRELAGGCDSLSLFIIRRIKEMNNRQSDMTHASLIQSARGYHAPCRRQPHTEPVTAAHTTRVEQKR